MKLFSYDPGALELYVVIFRFLNPIVYRSNVLRVSIPLAGATLDGRKVPLAFPCSIYTPVNIYIYMVWYRSLTSGGSSAQQLVWCAIIAAITSNTWSPLWHKWTKHLPSFFLFFRNLVICCFFWMDYHSRAPEGRRCIFWRCDEMRSVPCLAHALGGAVVALARLRSPFWKFFFCWYRTGRALNI